MSRGFLKGGMAGDSINVVLGDAGSNVLNLLRESSHALIFWIWNRLVDRPLQPAAVAELPPSENRETITASRNLRK